MFDLQIQQIKAEFFSVENQPKDLLYSTSKDTKEASFRVGILFLMWNIWIEYIVYEAS